MIVINEAYADEKCACIKETQYFLTILCKRT